MRSNPISTSVFALAAAHTSFATPLLAATGQDGWDLLNGVEVEEIVTDTSYTMRKVYPAGLENGIEQFELTGYVVLTWSEENVREFLLISDMGFCPFCGDPEHGTALQVQLSAPADVLEDGARITVRGALEPVQDTETTQATRLTGARILP